MNKILIIAPHPDDETLGCGGTILKHKAQGDEVHWLIVTSMYTDQGFPDKKIQNRKAEIQKVAQAYQFDGVYELNFATTTLDQLPLSDIIDAFSKVITDLNPDTLYVPHGGDIHSDHYVVFQAVKPFLKWFRYPSIKTCYVYEAISETDFALPDRNFFEPNVYIDISEFNDKKLEIMKIYASELGNFPFPRSQKAIKALHEIRGSQCGAQAAESFMLLKEIK